MNTHTRIRHSPQGQSNIAGKSHDKVYTQQVGAVPGKRADGLNWPFPNKPVSHRRPLNPRTQDPLDLYDFEKITITKQPKGILSPQEYHSNGIRETTGSQHPRKDSHRLSRGELQMSRAIHAKQLMLQEKLWRVEEKIRQKIHKDSVYIAAGDDQTREEERYNRAERGKAQTMLSEQQRYPVRNREMIMPEKRQEDIKQLRRRQDQRSENRMRNMHEEEEARRIRGEIEVAHSQRNGHKGTHEITVYEQEVSGELNLSRWENVKEHTKRKGEDEKGNGIWGETDVKSQDATEKAKGREQNTTSMGDRGWTREKKYWERTRKQMCGSDDERDMPQMSQQKFSHRATTENHRGAERKLAGEPLLPPVSNHSSRPEQAELRIIDSTGTGLQLLPCRICSRKFARERIEKHVQICKKVKQSHRQVFNSYISRTKGSAIEEFWKTHSRTETPEVVRKINLRQNDKANTRNLYEGRLPTGTSQSKWSK